ncbi:MAG: beta-N-acetylhexosaminidase [Bdellovibrio sp.]|nr:MAG: beta-N-acetylhexosaminidase [Bdellovibrio sp.]
MTLEKLAGHHLIMGLSGPTLSAEERRFLVDYDIAGVILFPRNLNSPQQIYDLTAEIQSLSSKTVSGLPLFVSIDMEGGRVARLKEPFTQWPPLRQLGIGDSAQLAFDMSLAMGVELGAVGINLDFAPVLDILTNPENTVIGDRAVSDTSERVMKLGSALVRGYLKSGIIPCGKHFPGHGNTLVDSHEDLPVEQTDLERLRAVELKPFLRAFRSGLEMVMSSHILFPRIDPEWPVTLSEIFLRRILREELRYRHLVISDDLDMKALSNHYDPRLVPVRALQAGIDLLLYCNDPSSPERAIDAICKAVVDGWLDRRQLEESFGRIEQFKREHPGAKPRPAKETALRLVGAAEHLELAATIRRYT